jgi:O-antigen/teichoic acid export membrane protein
MTTSGVAVPIDAEASAAATVRARSSSRAVALAVGARGMTLPITALLAAFTTRHLVTALGAPVFAAVAVLVSIPALLPASDLGLGAAVTNAAATRDPRVLAATVRAALQLLMPIMAGIVGVAVLLTATGRWNQALGVPTTQHWVGPAALALAILYVLAIPLGLGQRILVGRQRSHLAVALAAGQPLLLCLLAVLLVHGRTDAFAAVVSFQLAATMGALVQTVAALRTAELPLSLIVDGSLPRPRLRAEALPMMIIAVAMPLTFQSGRLLLSYRGSAEQVAEYSVAFQLFVAALGVCVAAGSAMWGEYAQDRSPDVSYALWRVALRNAAVLASVVLLGWWLVAPSVVRWTGGGQVDVHRGLLVWLGVLVALETLHMPSGMLLTDQSGIKIQAALTLAASLLSLSMTWLLVARLGSSAPVLSVIVCYGCVQVLPCAVIARRRTRGAHRGRIPLPRRAAEAQQ